MRVSILIPTRDRLSYLRQSLASARAQAGVDIEIIVSDDGSSDGTRAFVADVAASDERVRLLVDNPTPGIFENVEHLIRHATGDAYTILGDDDLLDLDFCALLAAPLEAEPSAVLSFTEHRVIDAAGSEMPRATRESSRRYGRAGLAAGTVADPVRLALSGGVWLGFTLFRRSAFPRDVFAVDAGTAADWDFAIRAATRGAFHFVPGVHASYRDHGQTASRMRKRDASAAAMAVLARHRFADRGHERLRRSLLVDRAKRHAFQHAADDPAQARHSLELYRRLGGRVGPHTLIAHFMLLLPAPVARLVHRGVAALSNGARGVARRVSP